MSDKNCSHAIFLNIDVDIEAESPELIEDMASVFHENVLIINKTSTSMSFELKTQFRTIEDALGAIVNLIKSLSPSALTKWHNCKSRRANIGIKAGRGGNQTSFHVGNSAIRALASIGVAIELTIYASDG